MCGGVRHTYPKGASRYSLHATYKEALHAGAAATAVMMIYIELMDPSLLRLVGENSFMVIMLSAGLLIMTWTEACLRHPTMIAEPETPLTTRLPVRPIDIPDHDKSE